MANVRLGPIIADIRGSIGDVTYARGRGGLYARQRVDPPEDITEARTAVWNATRAVSKAWSLYTSEAQRQAWTTYAANYPVQNRLGETIFLCAHDWFFRTNHPYYRIAESLLTLEPPTGPPDPRPAYAATAQAAGDTVTIVLPFQSPATPTAGYTPFLYGSPPQPGTHHYHALPYRLIDLQTYLPPWERDPWVIDWPWPIAAGQAIFLRIRSLNLTTFQSSKEAQVRIIAT